MEGLGLGFTPAPRTRIVLFVIAYLAMLGLNSATAPTTRVSTPTTRHASLASACAGATSAQADPLTAAGADPLCKSLVHPESFAELAKANAQFAARTLAPYGQVADGAYANAVAQSAALPNAASSPGVGWSRAGDSPLFGNDLRFSAYSKAGFVKLSGRIGALAADFSTVGHYFAAPVNGGVWESHNGGNSWKSIGDNLPSQIVGALVFSPANGGTLIAGGGDNATACCETYLGHGIYYSSDDGTTWHAGTGIPDGLVTFKLALDPSTDVPGTTVYAATSKGLRRSLDVGVTWTDVILPVTPEAYETTTGLDCDGNYAGKCFFASFVTDVVIQAGDRLKTGGNVMAAVGWRNSDQKYKKADGSGADDPNLVDAPQNGIYVSNSKGAPGTFSFISPASSKFSDTTHTGRTALGIANGPNQTHSVVYAIVQNGKSIQGCIDLQDITATCASSLPAHGSFLENIYVSLDFGLNWKSLTPLGPLSLQLPLNNSAMNITSQPTGAPGGQAWYDLWIEPDPSQQVGGVPSRVVFGLEEIWENMPIVVPVITAGKATIQLGVDGTVPPNWVVIGRYWNNCAPLTAAFGTQCNTVGSPMPGTTTHPDQHAGLFIPDPPGTVAGGVTLLAGSDGGVFRQHVAAGGDFSNDNWGDGQNNDLYTLLPYSATVSNDGTIAAGLQDNGELLIEPNRRQSEVYGGDGFFSLIDPTNSNNIVEEYAYGAVSGNSDHGKTWNSMTPTGFSSTTALFSTPMELDPTDHNHFIIGGNTIQDRPYGYDPVNDPCGDPVPNPVCVNSVPSWIQVYDLGTAKDPGKKLGTASSTTNPLLISTAVDVSGASEYAGWCGYCEAFNRYAPFTSGIATNVAGVLPPVRAKNGDASPAPGWHIASGNCSNCGNAGKLPQRYITSIRIDRSDVKTIYVTMGGYSRSWLPPGATGDNASKVGVGHVFKSTDAGENFVDISGTLPDVPANFTIEHNGSLLVATDIGVFISPTTSGPAYARLGKLPNVPVLTLHTPQNNQDHIVAATFGRGVQVFDFPHTPVITPTPSPSPSTSPGGSTTPTHSPNTSAGTLAFRDLLALVLIAAGAVAALYRPSRRRRPGA